MQTTTFFFKFIIFSSSLAINLDAAYRLEPLAFLRPYFWGDVDTVYEQYQDECHRRFNLIFHSRGSLSSMLLEIIAKPSFAFDSAIDDTSDSALSEIIFDALTLHKFELSKGLKATGELMNNIFKDFLITELIRFDRKDADIGDKVFRLAVSKWKGHLNRNNQSSPLDSEAMVKFLISQKKSYFDNNKSYFHELKEFRREAPAHVKFILNSLVSSIKRNMGKIQEEDVDEVATKIIELLKVRMALAEGFDSLDAFKIARDFGANLIPLTMGPDSFSKCFLGLVFDRVLKLFLGPHDLQVVRWGKQLLIKAFIPKHYDAPSTDYQRFILRKYSEELPLISSRSPGKHSDLVRTLYTLDVLYTSYYLKAELLSAEDIQYIFSNFFALADSYSIYSLALFNKWRGQFIRAGNDLLRFYPLHSGYYNLLLKASITLGKGTDEFKSVLASHALELDRHIDRALRESKRTLLNPLAWSSQDTASFPANIQNNYVFYKLTNLVQNLEAFGQQGIVFEQFDNKEDALIQEFTLQRNVRQFFEIFLADGYGASYHYATLAGQSVSEKSIQSLLESSLNEEQYDIII